MSVGIICDYAAIYSGNFISSILYFATSIKEENEVIFCFPKDAENRKWVSSIKEKNFKVFFFSRTKFKFIKDIRSISRKNHFKSVYFHFVSSALGKVAFLFKRTRLCFHIHSDFSSGRPVSKIQKLKDDFFDRFIKRKSVYIFVSQNLCNSSRALIKYFVANGLFKKEISDENFEGDAAFTNKLIPKCPVFLAFAWSPFVKGIDVLCKAFNEYLKENEGSLILVYGKNDGKANLIQFLKNQGISSFENVILLPPTENISFYYNYATCFVSSSRSEGFSYSILEAISYNKIIIASDIPGTAWCSQFNGVINFRSEDYVSLKQAMISASEKSLTKEERDQNIVLLDNYSGEKWRNLITKILKENNIIV